MLEQVVKEGILHVRGVPLFEVVEGAIHICLLRDRHRSWGDQLGQKRKSDRGPVSSLRERGLAHMNLGWRIVDVSMAGLRDSSTKHYFQVFGQI